MAKRRKQDDPLAALLETTPKTKLVDLLVHLASTRLVVRHECLDYLNRHTALSPSRKKQSEGEKLLALWAELAPDLDELDTYGGGDYVADSVTRENISNCASVNWPPVQITTTWRISTGRPVKSKRPWRSQRQDCSREKAAWMNCVSSLIVFSDIDDSHSH